MMFAWPHTISNDPLLPPSLPAPNLDVLPLPVLPSIFRPLCAMYSSAPLPLLYVCAITCFLSLRCNNAATELSTTPSLKADGDNEKEKSDRDSASDGPNLLGGAYDSSDDEDDGKQGESSLATKTAPPGVASSVSLPLTVSPPLQTATTTTTPSKAPTGSASLPHAAAASTTATISTPAGAGGRPMVPDEAKRVVVEKMVGFVARNGQAFEDRVRER